MKNRLINLYNTHHAELSKSEKHCLDYMLKIETQLPVKSLRALAEDTNTSTATVKRLLLKLGFTDIKKFKEFLLEEDNLELLSEYDYHLVDLVTNFDPKLINQCANMIRSCNGNIHIFAFGATIGTAYDLIIGLKKLGYQSSLVSENDLFIPTLKQLYNHNDLIIYISFSGNSQRLVASASILENHCNMVYIGANPSGKIGDYVNLNITTDFYTPNYEVRARAPLNILIAKLLMQLNQKV